MSNNQWKSRTTGTTREFLTDKKFSSLPVCDLTKDAIENEFKYEKMTAVQAMTIDPCLAGSDVLAKAKTGTGKTLAFLIPTIESTFRSYKGDDKPGGKYLSSIVISPTRELAQQIRDEAAALTKLWEGEYVIEIVYGGIDIKKDKAKLDTKKPIDLLVATPGRLLDHLSNDAYGIVSARLKPFFFDDNKKNLKFTLILDEADQLLEMGFRDAITDIVSYLPKRRQSLLFSATIPQQIKDIGTLVLNKQYKFIDCVGDDAPTVQKVKQSHVTFDTYEDMLEGFFGPLVRILSEDNSQTAPKVVCFFITARQTQFMAELAQVFLPKMFTKSNQPEVLEIHSRKSQGARNKANDSFREAGGANAKPSVLFSSDVSARGMDYPNVTHVIQLGAPTSKEQYLHRLGRTARAGESGQGILMLSSFEKKHVLSNLLWELDTIPEMKKDRTLPAPPNVRNSRTTASAELDHAIYAVDEKTRAQCYAAWLGYYNGMCPKRIPWSKEKLVQNANMYAEIVLKFHDGPPPLEKKTIGKMGLRDVPGLNIASAKGKGGARKDDNKNKGAGKGKNNDRRGGVENGDDSGKNHDGKGDGGRNGGNNSTRKGDGKKGDRNEDDSGENHGGKGDGGRNGGNNTTRKGDGKKGDRKAEEGVKNYNGNGDGGNKSTRKGDGKKGDRNGDDSGKNHGGKGDGGRNGGNNSTRKGDGKKGDRNGEGGGKNHHGKGGGGRNGGRKGDDRKRWDDDGDRKGGWKEAGTKGEKEGAKRRRTDEDKGRGKKW